MTEFSDCLKNPSILDKVEQDLALGTSLGVRGTPSFLIGRIENGQLIEPEMVVGAQKYAVFESVLEQLSIKPETD
ncbi:DsbA family protein [Vibrio sp.]|uniref:DsbA family protein n=1 Tax=Vibrio sp. TaxID=678 RepID=UPI003D131417